jgi:uncharacterized UPF0146 family protein
MAFNAIVGEESRSADSKRLDRLRGASELANFILQNYTGKVVEVGAGYVAELALTLSQHLTVVATDKEKRLAGGLFIEEDDIFMPNTELYHGASLLYSIRPPIEVQVAMGHLAMQIGADVIVRPLGDEVADLEGFTRRLINLGDARFYIFNLKS